MNSKFLLLIIQIMRCSRRNHCDDFFRKLYNNYVVCDESTNDRRRNRNHDTKYSKYKISNEFISNFTRCRHSIETSRSRVVKTHFIRKLCIEQTIFESSVWNRQFNLENFMWNKQFNFENFASSKLISQSFVYQTCHSKTLHRTNQFLKILYYQTFHSKTLHRADYFLFKSYNVVNIQLITTKFCIEQIVHNILFDFSKTHCEDLRF